MRVGAGGAVYGVGPFGWAWGGGGGVTVVFR